MKVKALKLKKISWKLTVFYAAIFSLVLILLNAGILYGVKFFLVQQSISQIENTSNITAEKIAGTPGEQTALTDPELLDEAQSNSDINIVIGNPDGIVVNSSDNFAVNGLDIKSNIDEARKLEIGEKHFVVKNIRIMAEGKIKAYLQVVKNMEKDYAFIRLLFILMAIADFLGIIISLFVGYVISRKMLKPIDKITKTAKEISISDLNGRIDVGDADDELARLAITFNEMIQRLKISFEKQNQFVSDASHELRTPISVIQGYIGLIDRWGKNDKNVLQESIQAIKNETVSMTELVEKLLFLARGDTGGMKLNKEKFKLYELTQEVIKESGLIAPDHNLNYKIDDMLELYADKRLIKQMLRALIDNSIKFTPKGGEISVHAEAMPNQVKITVSDTGIGIPKEELNSIFDRFYRVDKARTKELGGSGLGLSIVKWIVDSHDGNIRAESFPDRGTSMIITLPLF